jgi:hypothetical protein
MAGPRWLGRMMVLVVVVEGAFQKEMHLQEIPAEKSKLID